MEVPPRVDIQEPNNNLDPDNDEYWLAMVEYFDVEERIGIHPEEV